MTSDWRSMSFQVIFKDVGAVPNDFLNVNIIHKIEWASKIPDDTYFKINGIEYDVDFIELLKENKVEKRMFTVRGSYSPIVSFFNRMEDANRSILLRIRETDFNKLVNTRMAKNEILLQVTCRVDYEQFLLNHDFYLLQKCDRHADIFMKTLDGNNRISLTDEQASVILSVNRYTERIMLELPLYEEPLNNDLTNALKSLQLAIEGFKEGNYERILINTRNAVYNDITELRQVSKRKERVLKVNIITACLLKCPASDKKIYEEVLKEVSKVLASLVRVLSKFIHMDQGYVIKIPLFNDLELTL
jgi:hypothetical protein